MKGRPIHTAELAQRILDQLSGGCSLRAVCRDHGMPSLNTVLKWVNDDREGFAADYTIARQFGDDVMAGQMLNIVDSRRHDWMPRHKPNGEIEYILDPERVRRAELHAKTRYWLLSKGLQRKYGAPKDWSGMS